MADPLSTTTPAVTKEDVVSEQSVADAKRLEEANNFVRRRMFWSAGAGLVPLPLFDMVALTALELDMVRVLANSYGVPFSKNAAKSIISSLVGGVLPVALTRPVGSLLKLIPIVGMPLGVLSTSILGGAITYALGKVFITHFESGGTLLSFDPEEMNEYFKEKFAEGKELVKDMKKK